MGRPQRAAQGGYVYHVLNRANARMTIFADDGAPAGQEEYYDYIFPEEQGAAPNLKILEAAYKWKRQKTGDE